MKDAMINNGDMDFTDASMDKTNCEGAVCAAACGIACLTGCLSTAGVGTALAGITGTTTGSLTSIIDNQV